MLQQNSHFQCFCHCSDVDARMQDTWSRMLVKLLSFRDGNKWLKYIPMTKKIFISSYNLNFLRSSMSYLNKSNHKPKKNLLVWSSIHDEIISENEMDKIHWWCCKVKSSSEVKGNYLHLSMILV
ncbi:unnamed protein product [Lactuca virosa]|uniref:Uncharacterized protein n=1 Tax=Lactuca virosa TaxID=75947 RepID=A0AAU9M5A1_9ASTR|nr:unnamed protein product [Lactuca virosa]